MDNLVGERLLDGTIVALDTGIFDGEKDGEGAVVVPGTITGVLVSNIGVAENLVCEGILDGTIVGLDTGIFDGEKDGEGAVVVSGTITGVSVSNIGVVVDALDGLALVGSNKVKYPLTLTGPLLIAVPPITVTEPEPAAGILRVA